MANIAALEELRDMLNSMIAGRVPFEAHGVQKVMRCSVELNNTIEELKGGKDDEYYPGQYL